MTIQSVSPSACQYIASADSDAAAAMRELITSFKVKLEASLAQVRQEMHEVDRRIEHELDVER